ncbi:aldo/keto reductase [Aurantimonas sp. HBX-1]|uniref:aldo/keto reductase n=1 Tax=Aurantimonas sp. HBX-1 TaxID=2906072 RepID=UPI00351D59F9
MTVLAWLLQRSSNILVIPGISRRAHLHTNVAASSLRLSTDHTRRLNELPDAR